MSLADELQAVRAVIDGHQTTRVDARDAEGLSCPWFEPRAVTFGIYGAIYRAVEREEGRGRVVIALRAQLPDQRSALAPYTDEHGALGLIDAALAVA